MERINNKCSPCVHGVYSVLPIIPLKAKVFSLCTWSVPQLFLILRHLSCVLPVYMECTSTISNSPSYVLCSPCVHGVYISHNVNGFVHEVFSLCTWSVPLKRVYHLSCISVLPVYMECTSRIYR